MTTIFAFLTPISKSAVAVVRISGAKTREILKILTKKNNFSHQKISYYNIYDPKSNQLLDKALIAFFKSPISYTGEDVAELNLHGSLFIIKKIIQILSTFKGVRMAEAGEFSKIAFLNNKMDLVQAEAVIDLIDSETALQHQQSLKQLQGNLGKIYENWRFNLIEISALIEAYIDFPEDDLPTTIIDEITSKIERLKADINLHLNDQNQGHKIKEGLNLAIIGAPNVGKSSLINYLAKKDIAIVSDIAGTTRDIIETHLSIAGRAVNIADTAGLRESEEIIEKEGIRRAIKKAQEADLKIFIFNAEDLINNASKQSGFKIDINLIDKKTLILINKIDLVSKEKQVELELTLNSILNNSNLPAILISINNNLNLNCFYQELEKLIINLTPDPNSSLITQERYRQALAAALFYLEDFNLQKNIELAAEDLRMAARNIGKITGKVGVEDVLEVIFSRFCIGK
jgi:tRNA modification GTPase